MVKYLCDVCGEQIDMLFKKGSYFTTLKDDKRGQMFIVDISVSQGDLCETCARKAVSEGKKRTT